MPGDYTDQEVISMTPDQFVQAHTRGWVKPQPDPADVSARPAAAGVNIGSSVSKPQPSANVWSRKKSGAEFVAPSGQKCLLRPLQPEMLLMEGILDQVTRLDGLAQQLVTLSQGLPPEDQSMPSREDFATLLTLVNKVTIMAVVEPQVFSDDAMDAPEDAIMVSDIDLSDRIAILNESLKGVKALDNFRNAG